MSQCRDTAPPVVDAIGMTCPIPVIELARAIGGVQVGEEIVVLADDPGAKLDIPIWCRMKSHEFRGMDEAEVGWRFRVRRAV
jgi:TusA-related sulfurtransferase